MDWQTIVAFVAVALAALSLFDKRFDKSLSIREHDEYRKGAEKGMDGLKAQFERDIDRVETRMDLIESTRPTAGELKTHIEAISDRLAKVEYIKDT